MMHSNRIRVKRTISFGTICFDPNICSVQICLGHQNRSNLILPIKQDIKTLCAERESEDKGKSQRKY